MKPNIETLLKSLKNEAVPTDSFRTNARIRILNTVGSVPWHHKPRMWGYTVGTAIATVVLSVSTVYAAQSSVPGSTLYPVKILSEHVALNLSPTTSIKTSVAQTIISRRVTEVEDAQKQGNKNTIEKSIQHLNQDVEEIQKRHDVSQNRIDQEISKHESLINTETQDNNENKQVEGASTRPHGND